MQRIRDSPSGGIEIASGLSQTFRAIGFRASAHLHAGVPRAELGVACRAVAVQLVRVGVRPRRPPLQRLRVVPD